MEKVQKFIKRNDGPLTENREIWTINELKGSNLISYNKMQDRPSIRIEIQGEILECLLDTGAKINVINDKTFYSLCNA